MALTCWTCSTFFQTINQQHNLNLNLRHKIKPKPHQVNLLTSLICTTQQLQLKIRIYYRWILSSPINLVLPRPIQWCLKHFKHLPSLRLKICFKLKPKPLLPNPKHRICFKLRLNNYFSPKSTHCFSHNCLICRPKDFSRQPVNLQLESLNNLILSKICKLTSLIPLLLPLNKHILSQDSPTKI